MKMSTTPQDDASGLDLLNRIADKDRKAFETFYYRYAGSVGAFLMKILKQRELVDEAVNDFMLAVWQQAEAFDPQRGKLTTWLFGIAHNKGLKVLERHNRHPTLSLDDDMGEIGAEEDEAQEQSRAADAYASGPEREVMGWELGDAMKWAFGQLSPEHRGVLELCFVQDCSYQEMAEIMGCPINTIKTRMFNARKRLADLLAQRGFSPHEMGEVMT